MELLIIKYVGGIAALITALFTIYKYFANKATQDKIDEASLQEQTSQTIASNNEVLQNQFEHQTDTLQSTLERNAELVNQLQEKDQEIIDLNKRIKDLELLIMELNTQITNKTW